MSGHQLQVLRLADVPMRGGTLASDGGQGGALGLGIGIGVRIGIGKSFGLRLGLGMGVRIRATRRTARTAASAKLRMFAQLQLKKFGLGFRV